MNQKRAKRMRKYARKKARREMRGLMEAIGRAPFRQRLKFAWLIIKGVPKRKKP